MKNKFVVASLTAIALVTLSACGSTVQGAAVGGAVGQTAGAPTAPSDPTSGDDTTVPETSDAETTTSDDETTTSDDETTTSDDETTTSDDETTTSDDETTTSDDETTTAGTTDLEACQAVSDFTTAFAAMIQKIQTGTISQADVDKVFSAEVKAGLPASAQPTFEKLKDLSNRMVGKSITELADVATELTDGANDLRDIIKKACGVG